MPQPRNDQRRRVAATAADGRRLELTPNQKDLVDLLMARPAAITIASVDYRRVRVDLSTALAYRAAQWEAQLARRVKVDETAPKVVNYVFRASPTMGIVCVEHPPLKEGAPDPLAGPWPLPQADPLKMLDRIVEVRDLVVAQARANKDLRYNAAFLVQDFHTDISSQSYSAAAFFAGKFGETAENLQHLGAPGDWGDVQLDAPRVYLIAVGAERQTPEALVGVVGSKRYPFPRPEEIRDLVVAAAQTAVNSGRPDQFNTEYDELVNHLMGMTAAAIQLILNLAVIKAGEFGPAIFPYIIEEKKAMFERQCGNIAKFVPPPAPYKIAGFDNVKPLFYQLQEAWRVHESSVQPPRAVLFLGKPGAGKTEFCFWVAALLGVPAIVVSMGALQDGTVGSGQTNLRILLDAIDALGRCVVIFDEMIKETDTVSNAKRGGGTSEHLKTHANLMTWMERRQPGAIVMATGNIGDLEGGLPEGLVERFPYTFLVKEPSLAARRNIWAIRLEAAGYDPAEYDLDRLAQETAGMVGRDIRDIVEHAPRMAFADGRSRLATRHVLDAIGFFKKKTVAVGNYKLMPADNDDESAPPAAARADFSQSQYTFLEPEPAEA
jgi:hypothetical protein